MAKKLVFSQVDHVNGLVKQPVMADIMSFTVDEMSSVCPWPGATAVLLSSCLFFYIVYS
jgi:hypothetical protein